MAKAKQAKKPARRSSKKVPCVRVLRYELDNSGSAGTETSHYVDLARDLAAINRRMMEQGRSYHIGKITVVSRNTIAGFTAIDQTVIPGATAITNNAGFISVSAAPQTWSVINAVKAGKKNFEAMKKDALGNVEMQDGRYADFKIRGLHSGATNPTYLVPKDNGGNSLQLGEWQYSRFWSPDGTTSADDFYVHLLGPHAGSVGAWSSVGLVESYGNTRSTVTSGVPNPIQDTDDPLANLMDAGTATDERIGDATFHNENPPYSIDEYVGAAGNMARPQVMQHGTLGADGRCVLGGFEAIHGLLEFECSSPIPNDTYSVLVELKEGSYKGIKAEAF